MAFPLRSQPLPPATITSNPEIMGGWPRVTGTRIPAMTIVAQIRGCMSDAEIFEDYSGLPRDGIGIVRAWAVENGISLAPDATDDPFSD